MARVECREVRGHRLGDSGHRPRAVPKVRIGRVVGEAEHLLDDDDLSLRVRRARFEVVHEAVVADAVLNDQFGAAQLLCHARARLKGVGVGVGVVEDRGTRTYLPPIWLSTFAYSFSAPTALITPDFEDACAAFPQAVSSMASDAMARDTPRFFRLREEWTGVFESLVMGRNLY